MFTAFLEIKDVFGNKSNTAGVRVNLVMLMVVLGIIVMGHWTWIRLPQMVLSNRVKYGEATKNRVTIHLCTCKHPRS